MRRSNLEASRLRPTLGLESDSCPLRRYHVWAVGLIYLMVLVPLSVEPRHSGNVSSRFMTIESLVERGSQAVDGSPLLRISGTPDVVRGDSHYYSDKPPLLSFLTAGIYAPIHRLGFGFTPSHFVWTNLILVSLVVGTSSALALMALRLMLKTVPMPAWRADLLALSCGVTTLLFSYGVTFNNHSVAAGLMTASLALVMLEPAVSASRLRWRRILAGLLGGATAAVDMPAGGALLAGLGLWLGWRSNRVPWDYLAAAAVPLVLNAVLQTATTGTPLPVEMTPWLFEGQGSYWTSQAGRAREIVPRWQWGLELLVGPQGWLTVTPVLFFGLLGLVLAAVRRSDPLRPAAQVVGGTLVVVVSFYTWGVRRTDFAGISYGTRHLLALTPAIFFFAVVALQRMRSRLASVVFFLLLLVGFLYAWKGMLAPWTRIEQRTRNEAVLAILQRGALYPWSSYLR